MTERATRSLPATSHKPRPYEGPARDEVLAMRRKYLTPGLITYYRDPIQVPLRYGIDPQGDNPNPSSGCGAWGTLPWRSG